MTRFWRGLLRLPVYLVLGVATLWAAGALYFDLPVAWLRAPLARIELLGDFPICIAKDGTTVVALQWDYAAYTPMADKFSRDLEELTKDKGKRLIALSGIVSPRLRQELEARGDTVQDKLAPGPLK